MRIILADYQPSALWALRALLQENPEFDIVGAAVDAQSLLYLAEECGADLVLLDEKLPGSSIEDMITDLHELEPKPIIIVVGILSERGRMALRAGADAFVSKGDGPEWLQESLLKYARRIGRG